MFERFFGKPLVVPEDSVTTLSSEASAWLKRLPRGRDRDTLTGASELLEELGEQHKTLGPEAALRIALAFDASCRDGRNRLLLSYIRPNDEACGSFALHDILSNYEARLGAVYSDLLAEVGARLPAHMQDVILEVGTSYLEAWGVHRRLARFRQRPAGRASWQQANAVVSHFAQWHRLEQENGKATPFLRAYLRVVMEETVPWGSLTAVQMEMAARLIARHDDLAWSPEARKGTTHVLDLAQDTGPNRWLPGNEAPTSSISPTVHYLSTLSLFTRAEALLELASGGGALPDWLDSLPLDRMTVQSGLLTLAEHWCGEPPARQRPREECFRHLLGSFGFVATRALLESSAHAKKGDVVAIEAKADRTYVSDGERSFQRLGFGGQSVKVPEKAKSASPEESKFANLHRMEKTIPGLVMESWVEVDRSDTGLGVRIPASLPRHAPGVLVAFRHPDSLDWDLGVVRRAGRDTENRPTLGIEHLPVSAEAVVVHYQKGMAPSRVAWSDTAEWVLAILPSRDIPELILPAGSFVFDMPVRILADGWESHGRLREVRESGSDWERVVVVS